VSAVYLAEALERYNWRANFFVTTDRIDTKTFLSTDQLRWLRGKGHVIGSHSCSHPYRMSELTDDRLTQEWRRSSEILSDILKEKINAASVPGGFYTPRVARAADGAGIRILFNSEPTTQVEQIGNCRVLGRFTIYRGMSARAAGQLARGAPTALARQ